MMIISHEIPASDWTGGQSPKGLLVCDFDGTLLRSDRTFSKADLGALKQLGELGIIRVIATGRSIYSLKTVSITKLPVDYVIFSSGAGVFQHPSERIIRKISLEAHEVKQATESLLAARLDFMVHRPIPDNHIFGYFKSNPGNADFDRRKEIYSQFAYPLEEPVGGFGSATQLLAVLPPSNNKPVLDTIRNNLADFTIIQTTSPLDGKSTWIEIFPATVSKSLTTAWLTTELGLDSESVLSVGNDYNDLDLLEWSGTSFVVENAPKDLKSRFSVVASHDQCGVAEAVECWLATSKFKHQK